MKKLIAGLTVFFTLSATAQNGSVARDSVAQTAGFQRMVKMATLKAANNILADPSQPATVRKFGQLIITEPSGNGWLTALSYGCMTNAAVNYNSTDSDIEYTISTLFAKFSYAYYREAQPTQ